MKELVLTHNIKGIANIALVDYDKAGLDVLSATVVVKRVPSDSTRLKSLLQSGKIRKCYSELSDASDVWLLELNPNWGWASVSCDGVVSITLDSNRLETDDSAFLAAFMDLPAWSIKSKVFVAKLLYTGYKVDLRNYMRAVGKLSPEVASAFARMSVIQPFESVDTVSSIEIWGHTLNKLYGSNMMLLDPYLLSELNWLQPLVCNDAVLWRGMTDAQDSILYVYLKGDVVLYVGYDTLVDAEYNRYTPPREVGEVLTFDNLLTHSCEGLLEVSRAYLRRDVIKVRVCRELLPPDFESIFAEFLYDSMVLMDVMYRNLPNGVQIQTSFLYDVVNDKIYVFKSYDSEKLGTYYGEMTVEEWRERKESYIGTD